jgi:hypothetical protein
MRRSVLAGAVCGAVAVLLLAGAIVLNMHALGLENGVVSDEAFGPLVIGILPAIAVCVLGARGAWGPTAGMATAMVVLALAWTVFAVIGGVLAIVEPAVFNAGYSCLGRVDGVRLAVAMRPTPATCGYLIPASDDSLFYPAAYAAFAAAGLGVLCAVLVGAGRRGRAT